MLACLYLPAWTGVYNMTRKKEVGDTGEAIATAFLERKGFSVIERNYRKQYGEIDIIATRAGTYHFVEVKTFSRENKSTDVSKETFAPEENMHAHKLERLQRTVQAYLLEHAIEALWQIDLVAIVLFCGDKKARCRFIENVL